MNVRSIGRPNGGSIGYDGSIEIILYGFNYSEFKLF